MKTLQELGFESYNEKGSKTVSYTREINKIEANEYIVINIHTTEFTVKFDRYQDYKNRNQGCHLPIQLNDKEIEALAHEINKWKIHKYQQNILIVSQV